MQVGSQSDYRQRTEALEKCHLEDEIRNYGKEIYTLARVFGDDLVIDTWKTENNYLLQEKKNVGERKLNCILYGLNVNSVS